MTSNDVTAKLQALVEDSLNRVCVDARLDRLRRIPRPFDGAAHAEQYTSLTTTYAAHLAAIHSSFLKFAIATNAVAPVNQLPPDVLVEIMGRLTLDERITTSHVCPYWRATALESVALWQTIKTTVKRRSAARLSELLRRTKNAPIAVRLEVKDSVAHAEGTHEDLIPHMHRMTSLHVVFIPDGNDPYATFDRLPLQIPPCPTANFMTLRSDLWDDCLFLTFSDVPGAFDALERLHLGSTDDDVFKRWPALPRLLDLHIQCHDGDISLPLLEHVLNRTPVLMQLVLSNITSLAADPAPPIQLARLCKLGIASGICEDDAFPTILSFLLSPAVPVVSLQRYSSPSSLYSQPLLLTMVKELAKTVTLYVTKYSDSSDI